MDARKIIEKQIENLVKVTEMQMKFAEEQGKPNFYASNLQATQDQIVKLLAILGEINLPNLPEQPRNPQQPF